MSRWCEGRVAVVTGAGGGLGRSHALELARQGATVVVNDIGVSADGGERTSEVAQAVVDEIGAMGGRAVANGDDIADFAGAANLVASTLEAFGRLDVLVNNAGIIRDRMIVNQTEQDWDSVVRVHLRGTFAPMQAAARHWRQLAKEGVANDARIINTTSGSGLYGNVGQANYAAAKAGIASLTLTGSLELAQYGVTVNAVAPGARTRMTENPNRRTPSPFALVGGASFDHGAPENISPLIAWLASGASSEVTGRVFNSTGGLLSLATGWHAARSVDLGRRWTVAEIDAVVPRLVAEQLERADMTGRTSTSEELAFDEVARR
jgi:NAD(P)-dependent dehydrogenase (short-subunit alcohol dehydrogenase family)